MRDKLNREPTPDDFDGDYLKNLTGLHTIFSFQALQTATDSFNLLYFKRNRTLSLLVLGLIYLACVLFILPFTSTWFILIFLIIFVIPARRFFLLRKRRKERSPPDDFDGDYLKNLTGLTTIFSFQALQTATDSFNKEIGKGGFGKVYKGTLTDGTQVAVKCLLNQTGHGQREFCAEIATISSLNHSNLVSLRGVCVEGPHRILVYEFMPNESLDRWLFGSDKKLDWKTRYSIALDTGSKSFHKLRKTKLYLTNSTSYTAE